eukprot:COSAG03_NODE_19535_length_334_cov_5.378723_1_plen_33_part_10
MRAETRRAALCALGAGCGERGEGSRKASVSWVS